MKKASKKTAKKSAVRRGRPPSQVKKIQALVTIEVREGPLSKRSVADAVKTAFSDYSESLPADNRLNYDNVKRFAVNVNI